LLNKAEKVLAGRSAAEKKFIQRLLDEGEMKRWWMYFYPSLLAEKFGCKREKIVAVLNDLQDAGDAVLTVWGVRQAYKVKKDPGDVRDVTAQLVEKFQARELADLARLRQVLGLSAHRGCLTGYLTKHFGEVLEEPCGHCDRCRSVPAKTIKRQKVRRVTDDELIFVRKLIDGNHAALATPRQLARFLCGMGSPAATRARLTRNDAFGLFSDLPFAEVLAIAEAG
jgi:ATP-dependent DNA helicase RecQ